MSGPLSQQDVAAWKRLVETQSEFLSASKALFSEGVDRVALVREALRSGRELQTACHVLKHLRAEELQNLFELLVEWAGTGHGLVHVFREAIVALPRDWVLGRIETAAEPHLREGTDDEYRRFLELYLELDRTLAERLARRAAGHTDGDVREAGRDFLEILGHRAGSGVLGTSGVDRVTGGEGAAFVAKVGEASPGK